MEKIVEVQTEIEVEVIKEVIVEKIVYQDREVEVRVEVEVEKLVYVQEGSELLTKQQAAVTSGAAEMGQERGMSKTATVLTSPKPPFQVWTPAEYATATVAEVSAAPDSSSSRDLVTEKEVVIEYREGKEYIEVEVEKIVYQDREVEVQVGNADLEKTIQELQARIKQLEDENDKSAGAGGGGGEIVYKDNIVEKPVDRIVEVPVEKIVEKIVYQDKIVEVPVEKIVKEIEYKDRDVEKIVIVEKVIRKIDV